MIKQLYLLFCKFGIHRYEKIDINFSFGPGGSTETIKCKDCGVKKIRRKKNWYNLASNHSETLIDWLELIYETPIKNIIFFISFLMFS